MTARTLKSLLKTAGTKINKLTRKLGETTWAGLTDAERAAWLGWQQYRIATDAEILGAGRLVRIGGIPVAWFAIDTELHHGCRWPEWVG